MPLSLSLEPRTIEELRKFSDIFIETGTNNGGGVQSALEAGFEVILSCEIDETRFKASQYMVNLNPYGAEKITLYLGDSAELLPEMLRVAAGPAVVFLDAHREAEPGVEENFPLDAEFQALLAAPCRGHLVVVDDVDFCDKPQMAGWKLEAIEARLLEINPNYKFRRVWGARHESLLIADPR